MFLAYRWYLLFLPIGFVETNHIMQQAIKAFAEFHPVNCHILLFTYFNEFYERRVLLDFYKTAIKNNYIPTVLENINNVDRRNDGVSSGKHCSRPLRLFIMGNVTYITKYMIAEKRRKNIRADLWLLFVDNNFDRDLITSQMELSIGSEVYIASRTTDGYEFWEIYQAAKNNPIRIIYYGNWNTDTGLRVNQLTVLARRRDFEGAVLRAAEFQTVRYSNDHDRYNVKLLRVLWSLLEKELNFTTKFVVIPNDHLEKQSYEDPNDIIIEILARNEADVSMLGLIVKESGLDTLDYSIPVTQITSMIYIKKTGVDFDSWFHFFHPLNADAWYHVVSIIISLPVIILFMFHIGQRAGIIRNQCNFSEVCVTVYQMLCLQGGVLEQELASISLLFVFFNLWAFLIRTMYSAAAASSLAVEHYNVPFYSLEGLLDNGEYEFGVHRYSAAFDLYYKTDNWVAKKLNKAVMDKNISNLPKTYLEGLQRVCSRKKYAFMASRIILLELQSQITCNLHSLENDRYAINTVYAMSKHNDYLPFINRWLQISNEVGLMKRIKEEIFGNREHIINTSQSLRSLEFSDIIFLQFMMIIGVVSSISILLIEIVLSRMRRNQ